MLRPEEIDVQLTFDAIQKAGSMLGSAGVIVMNDSTCIVEATWRLLKFFAHESCGQCTPCREGTNWLESVLDRIENGRGRPEDADLIYDMTDNIGGKSLCPLGDAACGPAASSVKKFRDEFLYHIEHKQCLPGTRKYRTFRTAAH
jgi:NADH-quinone oxidoreductase subunit F